MPPPSQTQHLPPTHPATRHRPKSPNRVLAEAEAQWLFTEDELANTPSVQDGMSVEEERDRRVKGINFMVQVGIMLKLPQLTLSTASIFFQRFLMRGSLAKERNGIPKLHHFQAAATALFLATKVEESCRKMKELVLAFCRVAQKNPNLVVDEQSKDFWRWRDLILHNEDHMLETLCFDLTVESPHRQLFEMLKFYGIEHNKRVRNAAWAFVTDSNNTQLCLLVSSRTIAVASLYAACKFCEVILPDDAKGRPWWEMQHVRLKEIRRAVEYMLSNYDGSANKVNGIAVTGGSDGNSSIYAGLITPGTDGANDDWNRTRAPASASPMVGPGSERRNSNASSVGAKREREEPTTNGNAASRDDGDSKRARLEPHVLSGVENPKPMHNAIPQDTTVIPAPQAPAGGGEVGDIKEQEEAMRVDFGNKQAEFDVQAQEAKSQQAPDAMQDVQPTNKPKAQQDEGEVSEEGELEE
ncbi:Putative cyclin [Septoria linicola]|uniref:RNA polymerase II holoenzyme cyclin-like subunit n=1 Tax=Septoria linicola TaxID=215465 RepID=A0A9Q9ELD3_9PEZI|nr:Putative cyclin [Septoria linicola]